MNAPLPRLLTVAQAAEVLGVEPALVEHWLRTGLLPGYELEPDLLRIAPAALDNFIERHPWLRSRHQRTG